MNIAAITAESHFSTQLTHSHVFVQSPILLLLEWGYIVNSASTALLSKRFPSNHNCLESRIPRSRPIISKLVQYIFVINRVLPLLFGFGSWLRRLGFWNANGEMLEFMRSGCILVEYTFQVSKFANLSVAMVLPWSLNMIYRISGCSGVCCCFGHGIFVVVVKLFKV